MPTAYASEINLGLNFFCVFFWGGGGGGGEGRGRDHVVEIALEVGRITICTTRETGILEYHFTSIYYSGLMGTMYICSTYNNCTCTVGDKIKFP